MNWKTVIVRGDAEFFDSNLVRELSYGNHVRVIDDLSTGQLKKFQNLIDLSKIQYNILL
jgi:UDP-glucose 4-epimerase